MIHQYKLNGFNIVIDTNSGSIHNVDDLAYDIIDLYKKKNEDEIIESMLNKYKNDNTIDKNEILSCIEDIRNLEKQDKLFSSDIYENYAFDFKKRQTSIKALCLHIAHTCNLNCEYCFASQGKYNGKRALMTLEVGKKALDFLIENSGSHHNLEVDFFGGEPLMNFTVIKDLVKYAREKEKIYNKNFRFTLTTNGLLINDDVIEFANKEMHNVVLSLDGRKEVHDKLRKTIDGKGSYDIIIPKFKKFVEKRKNMNYYIRGTFTHNNVDFVNDILHMANLGFTELSMEPVVCAPNEPYALTKKDIEIVKQQYEKLAKIMLERNRQGNGFTFYHFMLDLEHGPCIYKRISGCGSGTEYLAVTPWGDLYPCHQFVGNENFKLGNIYDGITNNEITEKFKLCNAYARPKCKDCWAKLYCSGGCSANSYNATGDITGIYEFGCDLFKKRIECAIMMKVAESNK